MCTFVPRFYQPFCGHYFSSGHLGVVHRAAVGRCLCCLLQVCAFVRRFYQPCCDHCFSSGHLGVVHRAAAVAHCLRCRLQVCAFVDRFYQPCHVHYFSSGLHGLVHSAAGVRCPLVARTVPPLYPEGHGAFSIQPSALRREGLGFYQSYVTFHISGSLRDMVLWVVPLV